MLRAKGLLVRVYLVYWLGLLFIPPTLCLDKNDMAPGRLALQPTQGAPLFVIMFQAFLTPAFVSHPLIQGGSGVDVGRVIFRGLSDAATATKAIEDVTGLSRMPRVSFSTMRSFGTTEGGDSILGQSTSEFMHCNGVR